MYSLYPSVCFYTAWTISMNHYWCFCVRTHAGDSEGFLEDGLARKHSLYRHGYQSGGGGEGKFVPLRLNICSKGLYRLIPDALSCVSPNIFKLICVFNLKCYVSGHCHPIFCHGSTVQNACPVRQ